MHITLIHKWLKNIKRSSVKVRKKSVEAKEFRKYYKSHPEKQGHQEHKYENQLLVEFFKEHSDKSLCGIQPVTIGDSDLFFQLTTPLTASTSEIKYAPKKGGGIDILARRNRVLTIFELKAFYVTTQAFFDIFFRLGLVSPICPGSFL